jgi:hypothetical protein
MKDLTIGNSLYLFVTWFKELECRVNYGKYALQKPEIPGI